MKEVSNRLSFSQKEEEILQFWRKENIFQKSIDERPKKKSFSFYDGPPFATGLPHYGHLLAGTIKDVIPRYKTMRGYRVERRFGWDTHGLPVEYEVEQSLKLNGRHEIENFGEGNLMRNADQLFYVTPLNGRKQWNGWRAGLISTMTTKPWTLILWSLSGGYLRVFGKRN